MSWMKGNPSTCPRTFFEQSEIIYRLYALLKEWAKSNDRGLVAPDSWIELAPGVVRAPDVAYIPRDRIIRP